MLPSQSSAMTSPKPVEMKVEVAQVDQLSHERLWPLKGFISGDRRRRRVVESPKSMLSCGQSGVFFKRRGRNAATVAVERTAAAAFPRSKMLGAKHGVWERKLQIMVESGSGSLLSERGFWREFWAIDGRVVDGKSGVVPMIGLFNCPERIGGD